MRTYRASWRVPCPSMRFTPSSVCNGAVIKKDVLLNLIEREGFDVFLTGDKNMENQQRVEGRPFALLIMSAINWPVVRPYIHKNLRRG
jgi:hypothetical protein